MDASPLQTSLATMARHRLLWGMAAAAAVALSIWLLVAAGLQRDDTRGGTMPGPLPEVPSIVQADLPAAGIEITPAPGADIAPR